MKPAEAHQRSKLVQANLLTKMFLHIACDPPHLPVGKSAARRFSFQRVDAAVGAHELDAKQVYRLIDKKSRCWIVARRFAAEQLQNACGTGVFKSHSANKFNAATAGELSGASLKPVIGKIT